MSDLWLLNWQIATIKKVPRNLTNRWRLCIISCWWGLEVLPLEVLPHKLPHTNYHTHSPADAFILYTLQQMRNITEASVKAFKDAKNFKLSNTEVFNGGYVQMYLFWNLIAQIRDGVLLIKDAGRRTNTTKERLNGILDAFNLGGIYQKGKEADWRRARFFVDKFGNVEKWDSWKTFKL